MATSSFAPAARDDADGDRRHLQPGHRRSRGDVRDRAAQPPTTSPARFGDPALPDAGRGRRWRRVIGWAALSALSRRGPATPASPSSRSISTATARGRGVGRQLMLDALVEAARQRGYWKLVSRDLPVQRREPRAVPVVRIPRSRRLREARAPRRPVARRRHRRAPDSENLSRRAAPRPDATSLTRSEPIVTSLCPSSSSVRARSACRRGAHVFARGLTPLVLEAGARIGDGVRRWGHVRMFSPWKFVRRRGEPRRILERRRLDARRRRDDYPTGARSRSNRYLEPLASTRSSRRTSACSTRVTAVARSTPRSHEGRRT